MLEDVRSVDWARLSHSHGTAEEVPNRLAVLAGPSEQGWREALDYFWTFMFHQGSRYEASPYVVRFLFEVLENRQCSVRRELIDLLLGLAVGYGESFLPFGYDLADEEQRFKRRDWHSLYESNHARSAYLEVNQRAHLFTTYLRPAIDPETRLSAGFAVAHFAQTLSTFHQEVAAYIEKETEPAQIENLMLCFGMLGRFAAVRPDVSTIVPYLDSACSRSFRVTTSIALVTILGTEAPDKALEILLTALTDSRRLSSPRESWQWWNEGDLLGYAALALRLFGKDRRDEIARALCMALTKVQSCTFAIPETLLDILFPDPKPESGRKPSEFDDVQRTSLNVLLRSEHWRDWMISSRFLPVGLTGNAYQTALQSFLSDVTGEKAVSDSRLLRRSGNVSSWDREKHWP